MTTFEQCTKREDQLWMRTLFFLALAGTAGLFGWRVITFTWLAAMILAFCLLALAAWFGLRIAKIKVQAALLAYGSLRGKTDGGTGEGSPPGMSDVEVCSDHLRFELGGR